MTYQEKKVIIDTWKSFRYYERSEGSFWFWLARHDENGLDKNRESIFLRLEVASGKIRFYSKTLISVEEVLNRLSEEERQDILFNLDLFGDQ